MAYSPMVIGAFLEHLKDVAIYPFSQSQDYIKGRANIHDGLFASAADTDEISVYFEKK